MDEVITMSKSQSWKQLVETLDKDAKKQQYEYRFSNDRKFLEKKDPYPKGN